MWILLEELLFSRLYFVKRIRSILMFRGWEDDEELVREIKKEIEEKLREEKMLGEGESVFLC